jgi:hypothetical protein
MIYVVASSGLFVYALCWCVARHFFGRRGATVQSFRATPTLVAICTLSPGAPSASTLPMQDGQSRRRVRVDQRYAESPADRMVAMG